MIRNTLLHIETNTRTVNEPAGEPFDAWTRVAAEWFGFMSLSGDESQVPGRSDATASHKLESVYIAGANPRMRLTQGEDANNPTRVYEVLAVDNRNNQNRTLDWLVAEVL